MARKKPQPWATELWRLAEEQHGVVSRSQLVELGMSRDAIQHRIATGRLHRLWWGVYAVGRPEVGERGRWLAAVLSCGSGALLSHRSAAALWGLRGVRSASVEVVVPQSAARRKRKGVTVHRRSNLEAAHRRLVDRIPVTDPVSTLVDLAVCLDREQLARAVNEADRLDLVHPEGLPEAVEALPGTGAARLRAFLDRDTFRPTDSPLERRFLRLASELGLPPPETQAWLNGFRVDFYWPQLGLVVETDGLRYHRTAAQQATDRRRDQAHTAAGMTTLRFTAAQIRFEPDHVRSTLAAVARRLGGR